jgi:hypothetical protein
MNWASGVETGKISEEPNRKHRGIQYIGYVHQIDSMMWGWC